MRRLKMTGWLLPAFVLATVAFAEGDGRQAVEAAVDRLGRLLIAGDASRLAPILPEQGKIKLKLDRLGPEDGSFSSSQVTALLAEFLETGRVEAFTVTRVEYDPHGVALASARVGLMDKRGHASSVVLHLTFETENDRWVVREIRETAQ
jgi:hypothetical protein